MDVKAFDKHEREIETGTKYLTKYLFRHNEFSIGISEIYNKKYEEVNGKR